MLCPFCQKPNNRVIDKRDNNETSVTRRRRECTSCHKRFTTYERIENVCLHIQKRSGKIEEFDREKLKRGIIKAIKKREIPETKIEEIVDDIEIKLLNRKTSEIKSTEIGKMVLTRLKRLDTIGYLLYASVYRDFDSINDFENAIAELKHISNDNI